MRNETGTSCTTGSNKTWMKQPAHFQVQLLKINGNKIKRILQESSASELCYSLALLELWKVSWTSDGFIFFFFNEFLFSCLLFEFE